jgi:integrase
MEAARYLEDGKLVVFKRNCHFYARIRLGPRNYVWRSLKTSDQQKAIREAQKLFFRMEERVEQGLAVTSKSFSAVIDEYVRFREKSHRQGKTSAAMLRQIKRVVKFWREYAGTTSIEAVDDKALKNFIPWRRNYYSKVKVLPKNAKLHPTDKTLQWEMMLGKAILNWAHEQGYRGNKPLPTFTFTPKKVRVRPAFELPEYRKLYNTMHRRILAAPDQRIRRSRELLRDYVLILANSGMRVGEANNLRMRDVLPFMDDKGRRNYRFIVRGKTGERDVILRAAAAKHVDRLLERRNGAGPNDYLFAMPNGGKVITLIDQFDEVLKQAGITHNSHGEKYSLYSLRHWYAITSLRKGFGVFEVARNMGTSVQMIQAYYGKQARRPRWRRGWEIEKAIYELKSRCFHLAMQRLHQEPSRYFYCNA